MLKYVVGAIAAMVLLLGFGPTTATAQPVPSSSRRPRRRYPCLRETPWRCGPA